jgi:hypothetical protein
MGGGMETRAVAADDRGREVHRRRGSTQSVVKPELGSAAGEGFVGEDPLLAAV